MGALDRIFRRRQDSQRPLESYVRGLFAAGEQGVWLDPSDWGTLFQDSAGTTPVTAVGQPVGLILDKSGRGNHFVQPTATSRPTLQQDANGLFNLQADGVDDWLYSSSAINFGGSDEVFVVTGLRKTSDLNRAIYLETSANSATTAGTFVITAPTSSSSGNYGFRCRGSVSQSVFADSPLSPAPNTAVLAALGKISTDTTVLRKNGADVATVSANQGLGNFGTHTVYLFRRGGSLDAFSGNMYGLIVRGALVQTSRLVQVERYMNLKTRAY